MGKELLESRGEGVSIEYLVLTAPDDQARPACLLQLAFKPLEPRNGTPGVIQRYPARPCPRQQSGRGIRQNRFVGGLRLGLEPIPVDNRQIDAASNQGGVV